MAKNSKATTKATTKAATTKKSEEKKAPTVKSFFDGADTLEAIRIRFLDGIQGISGEEAKAMFAEYLKVAKKYGDKHKTAKGKIYESKVAITPKDWAKMVLTLSAVEGLSLSFKHPSQDFYGRWLWVSGETKKNREILKSFGFQWCPKQGSLWVWKDKAA